VKSYTSMEINGWVYLWFHAEGAEPTWTPMELEEITSGEWWYKGRTEHYINSHIEVRPDFSIVMGTYKTTAIVCICITAYGYLHSNVHK